MKNMTLSLMIAAALVSQFAIAKETSGTADVKLNGGKSEEKTHEHNAPHQGTLIEVGEEFAHLELLKDESTGKLTAYALDGEAENPVRLRQKSIVLEIKPTDDNSTITVELLPVANPLSGETEGDTSEYSTNSDQVKRLTKFSGLVKQLTIRGGDFKELSFSYPVGEKQ